MLRSLKSLKGYTLEARDGLLGEVDDIYLDADSWAVRYFRIRTGVWLFQEHMLVAVEEVAGEPDWASKRLPIKLSKEEILSCPEDREHLPVSRRNEEAIESQELWARFWTLGAPTPPPVAAPDVTPEAEGQFLPTIASTDLNLRSCLELLGYRLEAPDGEAGHVDDIIVDDEHWTIRFFAISISRLPPRKVLIEPGWITALEWAESKVITGQSKEEIRTSPVYNPSEPINTKLEPRQYDFYGRPHAWISDLAETPLSRTGNT